MSFTVVGTSADTRLLDGYDEAGVDRVTFPLPTTGEAETPTHLDELAKLVSGR